MIQSVWLFTVTIEIDGCQVHQDCYGTSNEKIWLIQSQSINSVTKVVESWSY